MHMVYRRGGERSQLKIGTNAAKVTHEYDDGHHHGIGGGDNGKCNYLL